MCLIASEAVSQVLSPIFDHPCLSCKICVRLLDSTFFIASETCVADLIKDVTPYATPEAIAPTAVPTPAQIPTVSQSTFPSKFKI